MAEELEKLQPNNLAEKIPLSFDNVLMPCEAAAKYVLPAMRAAVAITLINKYGYSSYRVSKILNLTPAAITNYTTGKRGSKLLSYILTNQQLHSYIEQVADKIAAGIDARKAFEEVACKICGTITGYKKH